MAPPTRATSSTSPPSPVTASASTAPPAAPTTSSRWASSRCTARAAELATALLCATLALPAERSIAATVPPGFQDTLVVGGGAAPATPPFAPGGRFFVGEKASGKIKIVQAGAATTFLDVSTVVPPGTQLDTYSERGLLGIAFDPAFATNGFVYVYHTLCKQ